MNPTLAFADFGMDTASLAGSLEAKLAAVRGSGFSQVMVCAADVVAHPAGMDAAVRAIRDSGLRITGFEVLRDFEGLSGHLHAYKVDVAKAMLEVCHAIGSRMLLVEATTMPHADRDHDAVLGDLRKLALLAIPLGIRIAYKALPARRSADAFTSAVDVVLEADCHNLGLALDSFDALAAHVTPDDLDAVDPEQVFLVQLSDFMWKDIGSDEEQAATASHFRVFPGEGVHSEALADFVTRLDRLGYVGDYSLDVCNDDYRQLPPEVVAQRARRSAVWLGETILRRTLPVPNLDRLRAAT
jgi:sugar phosphate isomerase/epimerase